MGGLLSEVELLVLVQASETFPWWLGVGFPGGCAPLYGVLTLMLSQWARQGSGNYGRNSKVSRVPATPYVSQSSVIFWLKIRKT